MELRFRHDNTVYTFDNSLSLPEAMLVKECTGLTAGQFLTGIGQMDGAALAAMVLLAKMRAGEDTTWSDLQSMDIVKLIESVGELNGPDEDADEDTDAQPTVQEPAEAQPAEPKPEMRAARGLVRAEARGEAS